MLKPLKFGNLITYNSGELVNDTIAYRGLKLKNIDYQILNIEESDYNYLSNVLSSNNVNVNIRSATNVIKYQIDLNNDMNYEYFYSISNTDWEIGDMFLMVVYSYNDQVLELEMFDDPYEACSSFLYFIDINKDNIGDVIEKKIYPSMVGQDVKIIEFDKTLNYNIVYEEAERNET